MAPDSWPSPRRHRAPLHDLRRPPSPAPRRWSYGPNRPGAEPHKSGLRTRLRRPGRAEHARNLFPRRQNTVSRPRQPPRHLPGALLALRQRRGAASTGRRPRRSSSAIENVRPPRRSTRSRRNLLLSQTRDNCAEPRSLYRFPVGHEPKMRRRASNSTRFLRSYSEPRPKGETPTSLAPQPPGRIMSASALRIAVLGTPNSPPYGSSISRMTKTAIVIDSAHKTVIVVTIAFGRAVKPNDPNRIESQITNTQ